MTAIACFYGQVVMAMHFNHVAARLQIHTCHLVDEVGIVGCTIQGIMLHDVHAPQEDGIDTGVSKSQCSIAMSIIQVY